MSLLADEGTPIEPGEQIMALDHVFARLLDAAREAGTVRADVRLDEVMALLTAVTHGALAAGWPDDLRHRTVNLLLDAFRPR